MSELRIYADDHPTPLVVTSDGAAIAAALEEVGVRFERWDADRALPPDADPQTVLDAYETDVARIMADSGFRSVDVVGLTPDHPQAAAFREKFLAEHTHAELEIRFFVEGSGQFNLHVEDRVLAVVCTQGDLISVPAGTKHWFDMGPRPHFRAIRFFTNPEGWVARFTGADIAERFPRHEEAP